MFSFAALTTGTATPATRWRLPGRGGGNSSSCRACCLVHVECSRRRRRTIPRAIDGDGDDPSNSPATATVDVSKSITDRV